MNSNKHTYFNGFSMKNICRSTLVVFSALFSLGIISEANATCKLTGYGPPKIVFLSLPPPVLTASRDTPNGTVVYTTPAAVSGQSGGVMCTGDTVGVVNKIGSQPSSSDNDAIFPLGTTGFGFRWLAPLYPTPAQKYLGPTSVLNGAALFYATDTRIEIVKIGDIVPGETVPTGAFATFVAGGVEVARVGFTQAVTTTAKSCITPDVYVPMGSQKSSGFAGINTRLTPKAFEIKLNSCATTLTIKYRLDATTSIINQAESVIALSSGSTAAGVGVQILDDMDKPLPLGVQIAVKNLSYYTGGNLSIPLKAAYYQTANNTTAGTANTSLTFTMTYL